MKKRILVVMCMCMALVAAIALTGCGSGESYTQKYNQLESDYNSLSEKYSNLQKEYNKLNAEYKKLQNLPDIVVSLTDDRDEVHDLSLHSSIEAAEKKYTKVYYDYGRKTFAPYDFSISCNNGAKIDGVYYEHSGKMHSLMDKVDVLKNTYTFTYVPTYLSINTIIVECNGEMYYMSFYPTRPPFN